MSMWRGSPAAELWRDDVGLIPLRSKTGEVRAYAIVDAADFDWANQWTWGLSEGGYIARNRPREGGGQVYIRLHRELLGLATGDLLQGDHIDRNRLNNRRSNLRVLTKGQNGQNTSSRRGSSSQFRGVTWDRKRGMWRAQFEANGKAHHLGYFDDEQEAADVARTARMRELAYAVD